MNQDESRAFLFSSKCIRRRSLHSRFSPICLLLIAVSFLVVKPRDIYGYTPDSPEVVRMVQRGYKFLEANIDGDFGRLALQGLVFAKDGKGENHPVVKRALEACRAHKEDDTTAGEGAIYETAVAMMFLCELDPVKHRREIDRFYAHLMKVQKSHGGWGYRAQETGDTSQTQYAVLSMWTARHFGIRPPAGAMEKVAGWLVRTQDPSGGFGYQGVDSGSGQRVAQNGVTTSLTAAGLGSVYILGDLLGIHRASPKKPGEQEFPPALRLIPKEGTEEARQEVRLGGGAAEAIRRAMADGDRWFDAHRSMKFDSWQNYFLYSYERYQSFRELAEGREEIEESRWYNEAVDLLKGTQSEQGSWGSDSSEVAGTSLAILFLTRSTKKAIAKAMQVEGTLVGGKSLKGDLSKAKLKDGKVVGAVEIGSADKMLAALEDSKNLDIESLAESKETFSLSDDPKVRAAQVVRLRRLMSAEQFHVRLVALRALGRTGDFDNVPVLIYALTDPDPRIVRPAFDALRAISRRFEDRLPENIGEKGSQERQLLVQKWKQWYKSVNPAAVFIE